MRMGVYAIEPGCLSASAAIDKANFARKQVHSNTRESAVQFDKKLEVKQTLTGELLSGLPQALENGEFKLYLQPKFSPKDLSVIGAEALTRWIKPDGTVVYPDQFIPILESTGRIVDLDLYIFEQVARFLQRNAQAGHRLLPIAVNVSAVLAREDAPTQEYSEILEKHNISARMLEIELTETAVVSEYDRVKRLLSSFQSDGMQTSLDDFGAGSSLLNNIVDIPVNTIKLDKLFLTRCSSSARWTATARRVSGSPRPSRLRSSSGGISAAETKKHSPSGGAVRHTVLPEGECCCLKRIIPWSRPGEPHRRSLLPSGGRPAPGRSGAPWRLPASA